MGWAREKLPYRYMVQRLRPRAMNAWCSVESGGHVGDPNAYVGTIAGFFRVNLHLKVVATHPPRVLTNSAPKPKEPSITSKLNGWLSVPCGAAAAREKPLPGSSARSTWSFAR